MLSYEIQGNIYHALSFGEWPTTSATHTVFGKG